MDRARISTRCYRTGAVAVGDTATRAQGNYREKSMRAVSRLFGLLGSLVLVAAVGVLASCKSLPPGAVSYEVNLSGANEVPPATTQASGNGEVIIALDHSVTATIKVTGMKATAAHIHEGAVGTNGPVIIPFTKTGDDEFAAPAGAKLTDAQWASYQAGNLYVNVHSARYPGGEVRAQLAQVKK